MKLLSERLEERATFEDARVLEQAKRDGFVPKVYNGSQTGALLREAAAALRAVEGDAWRPIETAPKDGRLFLCWVAAERWSAEDGGGSGRGADTSDFDFGRWQSMDGHPEGGYYENMMGQIGDAQDITHWQPLEPPRLVPLDAAGSAEGVEGG